jgi:hypothetical protein
MKPFSFADEGADNIPFSVDTLEPIQETPAEETPQSTTTETPETTSSFSFEEDSPETGEGEEQIAEPSQETPKLTSSDVEFKTLGDFLVESGIWKDFEGREEFEFTEDSFKTLWEAQARNSVGELLVEERNQFGSTANQLIDYLKNGGTVDDFVGNYTQQLDISSLDTTSPDGQEKAIKEYYSSLGWSDVKVKKHIERLKDSGASEFQEEADDCKTKLVEAIEEEISRLIDNYSNLSAKQKLVLKNNETILVSSWPATIEMNRYQIATCVYQGVDVTTIKVKGFVPLVSETITFSLTDANKTKQELSWHDFFNTIDANYRDSLLPAIRDHIKNKTAKN